MDDQKKMQPAFHRMLDSVVHEIEPPGVISCSVDHPCERRGSVPVAAVIEHRFAFYYWQRWANERRRDRPDDPAPDLLTIDWHDDVGSTEDFSTKLAKQLDRQNDLELAAFTWAGLLGNNDGHIAPAAYLDAIGDVFVLLKADAASRRENEHERRSTIIDRYGREHIVRYYSPEDRTLLIQDMAEQSRKLLLDIDMDFFTEGEDRANAVISTPAQIRRLLALDRELMSYVTRRLAGITFALEPSYCGGLLSSLKILSTIHRAWFDGELFGYRGASWRTLD